MGGQGTLRIGEGVGLGFEMAPCHGKGTILLQPRSRHAVIEIETQTIISNNASFVAMDSVRVGAGCLIGDSVTVMDCDSHETDALWRRVGVGPVEPVMIGNNVWLGSRVMVLRGVTIGDNSVVGAASMVMRPIPANSVAVGVPAKVVRTL